MSLVATCVLCNDNKWYKEPVYRGENYFLCFDDDEPPELVVVKTKALTLAMAHIIATDILIKIGIKATINIHSYEGHASRCFDKSLNKILKAFRFFLVIDEPPPPPDEFTKVLDSVLGENCCLYTCGREIF